MSQGDVLDPEADRFLEAYRHAEDLRLESEGRFRIMADSAPVLLWMAGTDTLCTFFNTRWLEFTGRPLERELGSGWAEGIHPEDLQPSMTTYLDAFIARTPFRMEYRLRRADGAYRWILDHGVPRWANGTFAGYIGSCIDVTDFRDAHDALRRLTGELELRIRDAQAAILARDEFLSVASHELRTPISALSLELSGMERALAAPGAPAMGERWEGKLRRSIRQIARLEALIDHLLDASRIGAGRLSLEPEEFDLAEAVREVVERLTEAATRAGCAIDVVAAAQATGRWDRLRLEQVLSNLIVNALKYGPGQPVAITVLADAHKATVSVEDHGIGIAEEEQARLFGRYERAVSSRSYGGLGLGLYIARQIVEAHGGSIRVASRLGRGATFAVELPRWPGGSLRGGPP